MNKDQVRNILIGIVVSLFTLAGTAMYFEWQKDKPLGFSVASYESTVAQSISSSTSSIRVASIKDKGGTNLNLTTLGGKIFLTLGPGTVKEEFVKCTDYSGTTFSGCTRGLPFSGSTDGSETGSSTLQFPHSAGESIIASNQPAVYEQLLDKDTDQKLIGSIIIATSSLFIGDGTNTLDKILYANTTAATSTKPKIYYDVVDARWELTNDGVSSFVISPTSTVFAAGKNISISSSVILTQDTVYFPTIYATTTQITGALSASGTVIFGYMGSSTSPNANNTLDLGYYGGAWRNIYASGTIYAGGFSVTGSGTTTYTNLVASGALTVGTTSQRNARLTIDTAANGLVGMQIRGTAGQTANLLEIFDPQGTATTTVNNNGAVTIGRTLSVIGASTIGTSGSAIKRIYTGTFAYNSITENADTCEEYEATSETGNPGVGDIIIVQPENLLNAVHFIQGARVSSANNIALIDCQMFTSDQGFITDVKYIGIDFE